MPRPDVGTTGAQVTIAAGGVAVFIGITLHWHVPRVVQCVSALVIRGIATAQADNDDIYRVRSGDSVVEVADGGVCVDVGVVDGVVVTIIVVVIVIVIAVAFVIILSLFDNYSIITRPSRFTPTPYMSQIVGVIKRSTGTGGHTPPAPLLSSVEEEEKKKIAMLLGGG